MAMKRRKAVQKECKDQAEQRSELRTTNLIQALVRRETMKQKAQMERDSLSQLNLTTITVKELHDEIAAIDKKRLSAAKGAAQKRSLIPNQVTIKTKVLGQNIHREFSHSKRQQPASEVLEELSEFIEQNLVEITVPSFLVEKHISQNLKQKTLKR